jgi:phosphoribosylanthranilate isomerase
VFLKVCGITRREDALHAVNSGATALGFVFWPRSSRRVDPDVVAGIVGELPPTVITAGVFVNETSDGISRTMEKARLTHVQLHGDEPVSYGEVLPWPILRSVTLDTAETTLLLDAADPERRGGTGQAVDWAKAATLARQRRVVLAGGLTPENVGEAIAAVHPYGIDVSSGVEDAPGLKNAEKVSRFLANALKAMEK